MIIYQEGIKNIEWPLLLNLYERAELMGQFVKNNEYGKIKTTFERSYKVVTA